MECLSSWYLLAFELLGRNLSLLERLVLRCGSRVRTLQVLLGIVGFELLRSDAMFLLGCSCGNRASISGALWFVSMSIDLVFRSKVLKKGRLRLSMCHDRCVSGLTLRC